MINSYLVSSWMGDKHSRTNNTFVGSPLADWNTAYMPPHYRRGGQLCLITSRLLWVSRYIRCLSIQLYPWSELRSSEWKTTLWWTSKDLLYLGWMYAFLVNNVNNFKTYFHFLGGGSLSRVSYKQAYRNSWPSPVFFHMFLLTPHIFYFFEKLLDKHETKES